MSYATQADMTLRFGDAEIVQLTDRANLPPVSIDAAVLGFALESADAEIDASLGVRYDVPLAAPPRRVVDLACDIARYRLYGQGATDEVRNRYRDAVAFLERVARGTAQIPGAETPATASGGGSVQFEGGQKVFARESLGES